MNYRVKPEQHVVLTINVDGEIDFSGDDYPWGADIAETLRYEGALDMFAARLLNALVQVDGVLGAGVTWENQGNGTSSRIMSLDWDDE